MTRRLTKAPFLVLAFALVLTGAGLATHAEEPQTADNPQTTEQASTQAEQQVPAALSGVQIFVDPETGQIRQPSPLEIQALRKATQQIFNQPLEHTALQAPTEHADGTLSMVLPLSYLNLSVVHVGEDGSLHSGCVDGLHKALTAVENPQPTQPEEE